MTVVRLPLGAPPEVAALAVAVHGVGHRHDVFRLPDLWQLHLYRYDAELNVDGVDYAIRPGSISLIPPDVTSRYRYRGRSEHLFVHFRADSCREYRDVPVVQDAGAETPVLTALLSGAIAAVPNAPGRVRADVWATLWRVALLTDADTGRPHAAVAAAMAHIESHLAEPLTVPGIAAAVGISHNHLTRLFRAATGDTVVAYLRRRRMHRARHLLRESTWAIASIAASVGIPDLQAFNKTCRRELGASPRALRAMSPKTGTGE